MAVVALAPQMDFQVAVEAVAVLVVDQKLEDRQIPLSLRDSLDMQMAVEQVEPQDVEAVEQVEPEIQMVRDPLVDLKLDLVGAIECRVTQI